LKARYRNMLFEVFIGWLYIIWVVGYLSQRTIWILIKKSAQQLARSNQLEIYIKMCRARDSGRERLHVICSSYLPL
jgi:hypothetical protein